MPHSFGVRARTRDSFSKAFKTKGISPLSVFLTPFKRGDYVDIKCDPSQTSGMPYRYYHGRTGIVFNVNKRAVGVEVTKVVGNRQMRKRIHLRIEHVRRSRCNENFLSRVRANDKVKTEANKKGEKVSTKRVPPGPKGAKTIKSGETTVETFAPLHFVAFNF